MPGAHAASLPGGPRHRTVHQVYRRPGRAEELEATGEQRASQAFHQAIPKRSALFLFFAYKEARRKKLDCKTRRLSFLAALIQTHMGYHKVRGGGKAALQLAARGSCLNLSGHPLRAVWWQGKEDKLQKSQDSKGEGATSCTARQPGDNGSCNRLGESFQ